MEKVYSKCIKKWVKVGQNGIKTQYNTIKNKVLQSKMKIKDPNKVKQLVKALRDAMKKQEYYDMFANDRTYAEVPKGVATLYDNSIKHLIESLNDLEP
jgi:hypothetical protein